MVERAGSSDPDQLMPFEGIDVEADVARFGLAPSGRSLSETERVDVTRQRARLGAAAADAG